MYSIRKLAGIVMAGAMVTGALVAGAADLPVKEGQKIAFLGDSITAAGAKPGGYVDLAIKGLAANGIKVTAVPAGISGHKSNQMLARLQKDVLDKKPDWMTLSCGVNDVWHGAEGVALEDYKANITKIVEQCQTENVKVMILTATMIREDQANDLNQKLVPYNDFLRTLAKEKNCLLADLNADMQAAVAKANAGKGVNVLTRDGVHMNAEGNTMMATGVLKAFGLDEAQLATAQKAWAEAAAELAAGKNQVAK